MMGYQYIEKLFLIVICIFEVYMFFDFMSMYAEYKKTDSYIRRFIPVSGLVISIFLVNSIHNSVLNLCCVPLLYFSGSVLLFAMSMKDRAFFVTFFYVIMAGMEIGGEILAGLTKKTDTSPEDQSFIQSMVIILSIKILTFLLLKCISRVRNIKKRYHGYRLFWMFLALPLSSFMIYGCIFYFNLVGEAYSLRNIMTVTACFALLFTNAVVFYVFESLSEAMYRTKELELIQLKNYMENEHYKKLEEINKEHERYRHDMRHFMKTVSSLIRSGDNSGAEDLLKKINKQLDEVEIVLYSKNSILNAVLYEKGITASQKELDYGIFIEQGIALTYMNSLDIITIFGNLIENAIDAASKCKEKGYIKLELFHASTGNFIVLKIKNTHTEVPVMKNNKFLTTKRDKHCHGIGLKNVEECIKKYGGILDYHLDEKEFQVTVLLAASCVEATDV